MFIGASVCHVHQRCCCEVRHVRNRRHHTVVGKRIQREWIGAESDDEIVESSEGVV